MATNPKPTRKARKLAARRDRLSRRLVLEIINEDRCDGRPFRKHRSWRVWYRRRQRMFRLYGFKV